MIVFLIVFSILFPLFFLYKFVYFRPISVCRVCLDGSIDIVSIKPKRKVFVSLFNSSSYGMVSIGPGLVAVYSDYPVSDQYISYDRFNFYSTVYILRYSKLRFKGISCSDRPLNDSISKFVFTRGD